MKKVYLIRCSKIDSGIWFDLHAYSDIDVAISVKESKEKTNPDWLYRIDFFSVD